MKITISLKDIKHGNNEPSKAYLCFRLRDKGVDLKVRSDLEVFSDYWDNEKLAYKRNKLVPAEEQKSMKESVRAVINTITDNYASESATTEWMKDTIQDALIPKKPSRNYTTIASRMEQYIAEHAMNPRSADSYKPTIKKLHRYEKFKQEIEGVTDFHFYSETATMEDYLDFREFVINEYIYYKEYEDFYSQFTFRAMKPRKLSSTAVIGIMHQLRIVGHWCIKMGYTTNRSCDAFEIPRAVHGTPFYLTLEERDRVYNADFSDDEELGIIRDIFMFQSMIGCRVGDLFCLTQDNINGDLLEFMPRKTMHRRTSTVVVPLNSKARTILKRYKGKYDTLLPVRPIAQYNEGIRAVLKRCGIDRMVTILDNVEGTNVQRPICEVATSHMARRNFIGNLYKKVKDPELVSSMTGHVNGSRAFERYREIDEETKVNLVNLIN